MIHGGHMLRLCKHYLSVLRYIFKRKVTLKAHEKNIRSKNFKGQIILDNRKCVKCKTCEKSCINGCINVDHNFKIDYRSCSFCGRCVESCPVNAINMQSNDVCGSTIKSDLVRNLETTE